MRTEFDYPLQDTDMEFVLMRYESFIDEKIPEEHSKEAMEIYEEIWEIATQWAKWIDESDTSEPVSPQKEDDIDKRMAKLLLGLS